MTYRVLMTTELVEAVARALVRQGLLLMPDGPTKEREIDEQWPRNIGHARAALSAIPSPARDEVDRVWQEIVERLNREHRDGIITYRELKFGIDSAALIRAAAITGEDRK